MSFSETSVTEFVFRLFGDVMPEHTVFLLTPRSVLQELRTLNHRQYVYFHVHRSLCSKGLLPAHLPPLSINIVLNEPQSAINLDQIMLIACFCR